MALTVNGHVQWPDACYACGQAAWRDRQTKMKMLDAPRDYAKKRFAEDLHLKEGRAKKTLAIPDADRWNDLTFLVATLIDLATGRERARAGAIAKRINWVPYFKAKDRLVHYVDQFIKKVKVINGEAGHDVL